MRLISVAVPVPTLDSLTYNVPDGMPMPSPGMRVLVPLGNRIVTGCVLPPEGGSHETKQEQQQLQQPETGSGDNNEDLVASAFRRTDPKDIVDVLDAEPFLPEPIVRLAEWVAEYYACGVGEAIATAMPPRAWVESERHARVTDLGEARMLTERGLRRDVLEKLAGGRVVSVEALAKKSRGTHGALLALAQDGLITLTRPLRGRADASRRVRVAMLTAQGNEKTEGGPRLGPRQQAALDLLRGAPDGIRVSDLADQDIPSASVAGLVRLGFVTIERRRVERDPFDN